MSVESDMDGTIVNEQGRVELDPPMSLSCDVDVLGVGLYAAPTPSGVLLFNAKASITMSIAELEELVRVAVRAGTLNLAGGRS